MAVKKDALQSLANSMNIEFKKSETKDSLLRKIETNKDFDLFEIYNKFKRCCFGIYPTKAQELLGIDIIEINKLGENL